MSLKLSLQGDGDKQCDSNLSIDIYEQLRNIEQQMNQKSKGRSKKQTKSEIPDNIEIKGPRPSSTQKPTEIRNLKPTMAQKKFTLKKQLKVKPEIITMEQQQNDKKKSMNTPKNHPTKEGTFN